MMPIPFNDSQADLLVRTKHIYTYSTFERKRGSLFPIMYKELVSKWVSKVQERFNGKLLRAVLI